MPTVYDGLFPDGTLLTRATRPQRSHDEADPPHGEVRDE
jgi:hypothetical protein